MSRPVTERILVVDDEPHICETVKKALERTGYQVDTAPDAEIALGKLTHGPVDLVLCDIKLPKMDGVELLERIRASCPETLVVMITGYATIASAVASIKLGAADYLPKPFNPPHLRHVITKALEQRRLAEENAYLKEELKALVGELAVVGQSAAMQRLFALAQTVAVTDSSVLIVGESGTGKEVLARRIHSQSPRKDRPFVAVNCAAIPPQLMESEFFGHSRGAFTGAVSCRRGSFGLAEGGTLFLDEIGEMGMEMQVKILRALEAREIWPVGAEQPVKLDVRIIAATNTDLQAQMKAGRFREDLYWRLNVVQFEVPPLRERPEDVALLARHFLVVFGRAIKKPAVEFAPEALEGLTRYRWPGNVRELRNTIERAVIFSVPGRPVRMADFPPHILADGCQERAARPGVFSALREMEIQYIREVMDACGGNRSRAAEILGVSPSTLWRRLGKESDDEAPH